MNEYDNDPVCSLELTKVFAAADNYSRGCGVACRVVNSVGETIHYSGASGEDEICQLANQATQSQSGHDSGQVSGICTNSHLYGCYQAERFGGQYIYFCPIGLTHWASPLICNGNVVGAMLGGPVHMIDPEEFMADEFIARQRLDRNLVQKLQRSIEKVQVVDTARVNSLSEILYMLADSLSDQSFTDLENKKKSEAIQSDIWDQINFLKSYAYTSEKYLSYPIEKESRLLDLIEIGDKTGSQEILNEILGHIFFSSGGSIEVMKARVNELVVLLSRAAIKGGADIQQIFGLNYTYLSRINSFRNIDEIAYWLSGIMARFTDQVFNLANVKHADVMYRAIDYVRRNYMKKITLEETAAHVFLSPAYFSRVFKEEMGENFNSYVNMIRVEAARRLLLSDKVPLIDIASMVGFEGQSYFSKVFKKITGLTPGRFREAKGRGANSTTRNVNQKK
jgi:AraC-like DNA-binding protein/ligand-binding sensor protein